jgi:hypothetical protein
MTLRLERLQRGVAYFDKEGRATVQFQLHWQRTMEAIEASVNGIQTALDAAAAADAAALAAQTAADGANTAAAGAQSAADGAQTAADTANANTALIGSYVTGLTLSATDAGTDASIAISGHTRAYGDGTTATVTGATLTGRAYSTDYWVYYDQATPRIGGAVTYQTTTSEATAAQTGDRHFVGKVTTPAGGTGPTTGAGVRPPGVSTL